MPDENTPMDADELMNIGERIERLSPIDAEWAVNLLEECMRARMHEAELLCAMHADNAVQTDDRQGELEPQLSPTLAQLALDTAEWLKTLWNVGYMGAGSFPAQPRSKFPSIELEDVLKSALFARIRQGKRPLPFPPPTRQGSPWHELLERIDLSHTVDAEIVRDEQGLAFGVNIEACGDWRVVDEVLRDCEYLVQHQGKGPIYRLQLDVFSAILRREPPSWTRQISLQERGGFRSYSLEWQLDDGSIRSVALRAATWERAESEAEHWVAIHAPKMYGQLHFTRRE